MTATQPASTPIATSKTAALSRVLDSVPKGYIFYTSGTCAAGKAEKLARKFHELYGIGSTPAQRITRKKHGLANALLVLFWPSGLGFGSASDVAPTQPPERGSAAPVSGLPIGTLVSWLLLVTEGSGPVWESEKLRSVQEKPRLNWLGYELVRHTVRGKTTWTWRRTKEAMENLYQLLGEQLNRRHHSAMAGTLERIARQPGFAGVREQSWALCEFARQRGYDGPLPHLFYVQKISHGERVAL